MKNGVLYRHREDAGCVSQQIVVPKAARSQILKHLHEGAFNGHLGEAKTLGRLCERFYWPGFSEDAVEWCKTCPTCQIDKTRTTPYTIASQSDGLVESFNRTMLVMLASTVEEDPSNWEQHISGRYLPFTRQRVMRST